MDITLLSLEQKIDLLKELVDNLDIVITAHYGAWDTLDSTGIFIATFNDEISSIQKDKTVIISTDIMTG